MLGSIPPLDDIFKSAGLELPNYLKGKEEDAKSEIVADNDVVSHGDDIEETEE